MNVSKLRYFLKLLIIAQLFNKLVICEKSRNFKSLAKFAIHGVLFEHFVKESHKVDIIYYGNKTSDSLNLITNLTQSNLNASIALHLVQSAKSKLWKNKLSTSSLLVFDSSEVFKETCKNITWQTNKKRRLQHLVYVRNGTVKDIEENIKDGFMIDSVGFLINETVNSIDLVASFMFSAYACRSNQLVTINRFWRKTMKWENSTFYPNKYQNLHGCTLAVVRTAARRPAGQILSILATLSKALNFVIQHKTSTALIQLHLNLSAFDLTAELYIFYPQIKGISSVEFLHSVMTFAVPPGELYSPLEKMFIMFNVDVWIGIIITLALAIITTQFINALSVKVQDFVYGRNIQTPILNVLSIFLTGAQYKVPGRNFARFLLILFIIWSLIIRTCYQSKLYECLQADMRKPEMKTFDEIKDKDLILLGPLGREETSFLDGYEGLKRLNN